MESVDYKLCQLEIAQKIVSVGSRADSLIVSLEDLRDLELILPDPDRVKNIEAAHKRIMTEIMQVTALRKETAEEMQGMTLGGDISGLSA